MKAAFVLGLAVAASAQADNEFATTYNPSGADLVRNAGWSQTHNGGIRTPIDYNTQYLNKYGKKDDANDDELVQTFYSPSGADLVKYAKQSQQTVYRPTAHVVRDDADDELVSLSGADLVKYAKQSQQTVYRPTAHVVRDDEADDELVQTFYSPSGADLVKYAKQSQQTVYRPTAHVVSRDDAADDELVQTFYSPSGADLVKYAKQSQQTVYRPTAHVVSRDDAADDELASYNPSGADLVRNAGWGHSHNGGVRTPTDYNTQYLNKYGKKDDANDDELVQTFYSPSGADLVKYAKQSQQTVYRPTAHVVRDDEADDELAYLAHLIKETKIQEKPEIRRFRHADKN